MNSSGKSKRRRMKGILRPNPYGAKCDESALREGRALESRPSAKKRRIGFVIDDDLSFRAIGGHDLWPCYSTGVYSRAKSSHFREFTADISLSYRMINIPLIVSLKPKRSRI
jgi:hypothetical protein